MNTFKTDIESERRRSEDGSSVADADHSLGSAEAALSTDIDSDIVWALQDVSFDVHEGEVVGIIGHNGAGKSTLLKVLSRITDPTGGHAIIRGRVSSLLEVGTGFHAELTGRENVYMNGTILGMTKREIDSKFDEIVEFSGVNRFLDTPVKRYSSGMKVRLAFAVAAHLDPEILIIDEVLAVGDAGFQRKCIGKMQDVAESGRTVLFVSHNAVALRSLCSRGILLQGGRSVMDGELTYVLDSYLAGLNDFAESQDLATRTDRRGAGKVRMQSIAIENERQKTIAAMATGQPSSLVIRLNEKVDSPHCALHIYDSRGQFVVDCDSRLRSQDDHMPSVETDLIVCNFPEMLLVPGKYRVDAHLFVNGERQDHVTGAFTFDVISGKLRDRPLRERNKPPIMVHPHRWTYPSP